MHVLSQYAKVVTATGAYVEANASSVAPGMVLERLEGVDWGDQTAVVLDVQDEDSSSLVTVWLVDTEEEKSYRVPNDAAFQAREPARDPETDEREDFPATSWDPLAIDEHLDPVRYVPDSYYPYTEPNHPSSIERTLWRPTLRRSPIYRYYENLNVDEPNVDEMFLVMDNDALPLSEPRPDAGDLWHAEDEASMPMAEWNAQLDPLSDIPPELQFESNEEGWAVCWGVVCTYNDGSKDVVGCEATPADAIALWNAHVQRVREQRGASTTMRNRNRPNRRSTRRRRAELVREPRGYNFSKPDVFIPKLDEDGKPIVPLYPDLIGYDVDPYEPCELATAAQAYYESYQTWRDDIGTQYIVPAHYNAEASEYMFIFAADHGLDLKAAHTLWQYMVDIGMFPQSEYDAWRHQLAEHQLNVHRWDDLA